MKKSQIKNIIPHYIYDENYKYLSDWIVDFYIQIIEQRLNQPNFTAAQKLALIGHIIENLKSDEINPFHNLL